MAWGNPPTSGDDMTEWEFIQQFQDATIERYWGKGDCIWPASNGNWNWRTEEYVWSVPYTVPGNITATSFTDNTVNPDGEGTPQGWCDSGHDNPWHCVPYPRVPWSPRGQWILVIDDPDGDYTKVVKARITSWTAFTLNFEDISHYVTSGHITSISSLVGRRYHIIRGDHPGIFYHERVMEWPNDYEHARGIVKAVDGSVVTCHFPDPEDDSRTFPFRWQVNEHNGRDFLAWGSDGLLKRYAVSATTDTTVTVGANIPVGAEFIILDSGGRGYPGRTPTYPWWWYRGHREGFKSHDWDDGMRGAAMPVNYVKVPCWKDGEGCTTCDEPAWEWDYWTPPDGGSDIDMFCGRKAEKYYAKDFWKTIRAWQQGLEEVSPYYVEVKNYEGAASIPTINPAVAFKLAGVNWYQVTSTNVPGDSGNTLEHGSINYPYTPIEITWALQNSKGEWYKWGYGRASSNTSFDVDPPPSGSSTFVHNPDPEADPELSDEGKTLVISLGWTQFCPLEFKRMFDQWGFIPDVAGDPPGVIDGPRIVDFDDSGCLGVGNWIYRPKSTHYIDPNPQQLFPNAKGYADESSEPRDEITTGDVARFRGDNFLDPSVVTRVGYVSGDEGNEGMLAQFFDHLYVGNLKPVNQRAVEQQTYGTATSGTTRQLTDTNQNWWSHVWMGGGSNHDETGTATSGGTTSLTDANKNDPNAAAHCWWAADRFTDFTNGPYSGFTVEVRDPNDDAEGNEVWHKRLITTGNESGVTITWAEPLPFSAGDRPYRIREPRYILNRWKDRTVKLVRRHPDTGAEQTHTSIISGNDDTTIFLATPCPWVIDSGTQYKIHDPVVGGVYKWDGSKWVEPTGDDAQRIGVPTPLPWRKGITENLPHYVKRYGRFMVGNAVCLELFDELKRVIDVLLWVKWGHAWCNKQNDNPDDPGDYNHRQIHGYTDWSGFEDFEETKAEAISEWAIDRWINDAPGWPPPDGIPDYDVRECGGAPYAYSAAGGNGTCCFTYVIGRRWAYPYTVNQICTRQSCRVSFYNFSLIPYKDGHPDPGCWAYVDENDPGDSDKSSFATSGDPVIFNAWHKHSTVGPQKQRRVWGAKLGSLGLPDEASYEAVECCSGGWNPDCPGAHGCRHHKGYEVVDQTSVLEWNCPGGFVYQP